MLVNWHLYVVDIYVNRWRLFDSCTCMSFIRIPLGKFRQINNATVCLYS